MGATINVSGHRPHTCISIWTKERGEHRVGLAILDASELFTTEGSLSFYVNRIIVPDFMRGKGVGTELMQALAHFADEHSATMYIDPTANYGSDVVRLTRFFARFGFVTSTDMHKPFGKMVRKA